MARGRPKRTELTEQQKQAIDYLVLRDQYGMTMEDVAEAVGVSSRTLRNWRNDKLFNKELSSRAELVQQAIIPDALAVLNSIIRDPKTRDSDRIKAIQLALKHQGKLKPKVEVTHKSDEQPDMLDMIDRLKTEREYNKNTDNV